MPLIQVDALVAGVLQAGLAPGRVMPIAACTHTDRNVHHFSFLRRQACRRPDCKQHRVPTDLSTHAM